ncbi:MAG: DUF1698 domain-containing protein, partial [Arsenophonus sp. ER-EMS1-MAG3]
MVKIDGKVHPLRKLYQLKNQLVSGGELVLESLVINGD